MPAYYKKPNRKNMVKLVATTGLLTYISRDERVEWFLEKPGDSIYMDFDDFEILRTKQRRFLTKPWVLVEEPEDFYEHFPDLKQIRENYLKVENMDWLGDDFADIKDRLSDIPIDVWKRARLKIVTMIRENKITDVRTIKYFEDIFVEKLLNLII